MSNSTHKIEVVPVELLPHPDADSLSLVQVYGYTVIVNTKMWEGVKLAAYCPPDSLVDTNRSEFAFLKQGNRTEERIKVKRLRGILSMGLLVPAPEGSRLGDDVAEILGVGHWQPKIEGSINDRNVGAPPVYSPKYDVDAFYRYMDIFEDFEPVWVSEKCNGSNMRLVYVDGKQYVGSRNYWKEESDTNIFWRAFRENPYLEQICRDNEGDVIYGECYGCVKGFKYDTEGEPKFRAFDVLKDQNWLHSYLLSSYSDKLPLVPTIKYNWYLDKKEVVEMAEGKSLIGSNIREGIVIKPMTERYDKKLGRVCLKLVGEGYYNLK